MSGRVVLGLAGRRGSGKDTLAALLAPHGFKRVALADPLKGACREVFGFTPAQMSDPVLKEAVDPAWGFSPRWAMQRLGTEGVRQSVGEDVWVRALLRRLDAEPGHVVVTDVRFLNEVEAVRSRGGIVLLVERPGTGGSHGLADHPSEVLPDQRGLFNAVVRNDGAPADMLRHPAVRDLLAALEPAPDDALLAAALRVDRAALKDAAWLRVAREVSVLGTCRRLRVGCVLLRADGSVAGVGYNGALPGAPHCDPAGCNASAQCLRTRHAERSALDYSDGPVATAYVTDEPCLRCAQDLAARGVRRVVFGRPYSSGPEESAARAALAAEQRLSWERLRDDPAATAGPQPDR